MKKFLYSNIFFLTGLILTLSLLWPLVSEPFFTHHDDVQVIRVHQMHKCFLDGQIPCRWVPDLGGLYGYPIFNYYAPLPYYFGELIYVLSGSLLFSAKMMFAASFVGSFIFMYLFASKFWGKMGGSLAAIFYSFAPYHALDFYIRGAMGEMWALMLFPAILWAAARLESRVSALNMTVFGVMIAALITSHNLSSMIFLPLVLVWLALLFIRKKSVKFLWFSLGSVVIAMLLAAFYLLPAVVEKNLVHVDTTTVGYFSFTEHFKGLRKLFLERSWGYGSSVREVPGGERDKLSYQIGWVHLGGWILSLIAARIFWKKERRLSYIIIFSSLAVLFSVFMVHPRSQFVWQSIESLKYLQFPWRFLLLIIFFVSFISGSIFLLDFKHKRKLWVFLIVLVVLLNFSYFKPEKFMQTSDPQRLSGLDWDKQIKRSIFDYLPIFAKEPPAELATSRYEILTGDSRIYDFKEGTNWISFKAQTKSHTIIRLSQYYFPDWKVFVDGSQVNLEYKNNTLGLMTFILGKGDHEISARLYDTQVRTISNMLTLVGLTLTGILLLLSSKKVRGWVTYYRKRMN